MMDIPTISIVARGRAFFSLFLPNEPHIPLARLLGLRRLAVISLSVLVLEKLGLEDDTVAYFPESNPVMLLIDLTVPLLVGLHKNSRNSLSSCLAVCSKALKTGGLAGLSELPSPKDRLLIPTNRP
jgi:hypothetical protein